ncbi:hypothetical protein EW146_g2431 [Bondarzewia mesenterica]|uniref:HAMP domain-containing protein n=1 Tax=Bondarzewia mesenterica TaxID=1095465 RepID=A0A4S4M0R9_9AGAM|nr:hypothetical protein EW146_g2431 [Bondarzewia mesenterica]
MYTRSRTPSPLLQHFLQPLSGGHYPRELSPLPPRPPSLRASSGPLEPVFQLPLLSPENPNPFIPPSPIPGVDLTPHILPPLEHVQIYAHQSFHLNPDAPPFLPAPPAQPIPPFPSATIPNHHLLHRDPAPSAGLRCPSFPPYSEYANPRFFRSDEPWIPVPGRPTYSQFGHDVWSSLMIQHVHEVKDSTPPHPDSNEPFTGMDPDVSLSSAIPMLTGRYQKDLNAVKNLLARDVTRISQEVRIEGKLGSQAAILDVEVRNIAHLTKAVTLGDLLKQIDVDAGGEILDLENTVNGVAVRLRALAAEVTRATLEVGSQDDVTIAKSITLKDKFENLGARLIQNVAQKINKFAGDGIRLCNPMDLCRGAQAAIEWIVEFILKNTKMVTATAEIAQVATISVNDDIHVGNLIAQVMEKVGKEGVIIVKEGRMVENDIETTEGMCFDRGFISPYFIMDVKVQKVEFVKSLFLLSEKKFFLLQDILPFLDTAAHARQPLLIIVEDVDGKALAACILNKLRG